MRKRRWTKKILEEAVKESASVAGVLRCLQLPQVGGNHVLISKRIREYGIDCSHFTGRAHQRGKPAVNRKSSKERLVMGAAEDNRVEASRLRRALVEIGRPYKCAGCGLDPIWNERPLVLHVDHIDGQWWNNLPENLRFLCPNCHSQTDTFCSRNHHRRKPPLYTVPKKPVLQRPAPKPRIRVPPPICKCGALLSKQAKSCAPCSHRAQERIEWPDSTRLQEMVNGSSYLAVGRELGVSDNAVRKRLRNHS